MGSRIIATRRSCLSYLRARHRRSISSDIRAEGLHWRSTAWCKATRGSFIVDIRLVASQGQLCSYVTKYVSCPVTSSIRRDSERLNEAVAAMHGMRTCTTFGSWRGTPLTPKQEADEWVYVGDYNRMRHDATYNPWGETAHILREVTARRHADQTEAEQRGPPVPEMSELHYDYRED